MARWMLRGFAQISASEAQLLDQLVTGALRATPRGELEAARSLGFAARFVTGYNYVPDRDGPQWLGGGSTHAWCQVYVPGSGWIEFDPTNGIVGNRDLIRVAVARDARQAIPLHGSYWGKVEDEKGMVVSVNVRRLPDPAPSILVRNEAAQ